MYTVVVDILSYMVLKMTPKIGCERQEDRRVLARRDNVRSTQENNQRYNLSITVNFWTRKYSVYLRTGCDIGTGSSL